MNQEFAQFAGPLLALAGFFYQWVRQYSHISDMLTGVFATVLACGVYALCFDYGNPQDAQHVIIQTLLWLSGAIPTVLGGTFTASSLAKAGAAPIPLTNSR